MLQFIHKYLSSLIGVIFLGLMAVMLFGSGFGGNILRSFTGRRSSDYAIKVNGTEISRDEFSKLSRDERDQGSTQQTVDQLVSSALIEQEAAKLGLDAGENSVRLELATTIFQGNFSVPEYQEFLSRVGMSAAQFEDRLRTQAIQGEFVQLLTDVSFASDREVSQRLESERAKYGVSYLEFDSQHEIEKAPAPKQEDIDAYYAEHTSEFEMPAGVAYNYVLFSPEKYQKSVEVSPDDVELYYADHENEFREPETAKVRRIRLLFGKDATPEDKNNVKEKANQVLSRAKANEPFDALALEFSDDLSTKTKGGDLGWISHGKMTKEFDDAVFRLKEPGIAELAQSDYGFDIIKVDEYKAADVKPLSAVRDEIVAALQKRDAPIYAANQAQDFFEKWKKSGNSLTDFAKQNNLTVAPTKDVLTKDVDPENDAKGLTDGIIQNASDSKQLVDIGEKLAMVEVTKSRDADVAPLAQVKDKVITDLKTAAAKDLSHAAAQHVLDEISKDPASSVAKVGESEKMAVKTIADAQRIAPPAGLLANPAIANSVFSTYAENTKPTQVFEDSGKFYIVQVTSVKKPDAADTAKFVSSFKQMEGSQLGNIFAESIVNTLKKNADVDVNPQILAGD